MRRVTGQSGRYFRNRPFQGGVEPGCAERFRAAVAYFRGIFSISSAVACCFLFPFDGAVFFSLFAMVSAGGRVDRRRLAWIAERRTRRRTCSSSVSSAPGGV